MVNVSDFFEKMRSYNRTLSGLTPIERSFVKATEETDYYFGLRVDWEAIPSTVSELLRDAKRFKALLPGHSEELCEYLTHIQEFTCNTGIVRMDVRSSDLSNYKERVKNAVWAFYRFYGMGLSMQQLIYGAYKEEELKFWDMSPVIAGELLCGNAEAIGYCKEVLTSENNTAFLTRDLIIAIEKSQNRELQELLTNILVAAKLQEGVRQSILETADEYQLDYFYRILDVIRDENLLRYSSAQRSVLTWIGLGYYEDAKPRLVNLIFDRIYTFLHDESARKTALFDENPLTVYIALYSLGVRSLEQAVEEAVRLLEDAPRHVVAAALVYLKLTNHFSLIKYKWILNTYRDDEWITALYLGECTKIIPNKLSFTKAECGELFDLIYPFLDGMKAQQTVYSKGFEWFVLSFHKDSIVSFLAILLTKAPGTRRVDLFMPYAASLYGKMQEDFLKSCFSCASLPVRKEFMIKEIISQKEALCRFVADELLRTSLTQDDILKLEGRLKTKRSYARAAIVQVLAAQPKKTVRESFERLNRSGDKLIRESAEELRRLAPACFEDAVEPEIKVLGKEDGFGLYERNQRYPLPETEFLSVGKKGFFKKRGVPDLSFLNVWEKNQIVSYLDLWDRRVEEHALDEYQRFGEQHLVGDIYLHPLDYQKQSLDALPLGNVWREYFEQDKLSADVVFQLYFVLQSAPYNYKGIFPPDIRIVSLTEDDIKRWKYAKHVSNIIYYYFLECGQNNAFLQSAARIVELFLKYSRACAYKTRDYGDEIVVESLINIVPFRLMVDELRLDTLDDEQFLRYFPLVYHCYLRFHLNCTKAACGSVVMNKMTLSPLTVSRACTLGLLPRSVLMEIILDMHTEQRDKPSRLWWMQATEQMLGDAYSEAYFAGRSIMGMPNFELPKENTAANLYLRETLDIISDTLIPMETTRLNEVTPVTGYVQSLRVVRGVRYLLLALKMLEGEEIKRDTYGDDRNTVFGNIIRYCYPLPDDSPMELKQANIPEARLVEVAMMAPQWMDFVNDVLGWDGFKDACYYFIAHMKQQDDPERKKAEIAHYTDLDPADLSDGAFDIEWCKSICSRLGDKRVKVLYKAAKLLCENSFHTRARKYLDACTGKGSKEEYRRQASEKRNKDALNAYCIVPLADEQDLLERYLYLQQFMKESKTFGAQRQASEKRSCQIALLNLARNAHYDSADRLTWKMESMVTDLYSDVFEPVLVEDIELRIVVDENGQNEISAVKNGKKLKSLPARLKNNEHVLRLKEAHKLLTQQYRRTRAMLEKAMEERTEFDSAEIDTMAKHIIAGPLLRRLVLCCNGFFGFYQDGRLVMGDESVLCTGTVRIAHAVELYQQNVLREFQEYIFEEFIVQPFKQVFREIYLKLDEELPHEYTKRYTGYQIQTKQAAAALKGRGWNVSYECGLEKVCYKQDAVVNLYADADWFSPSDIEAPSIDYVEFSNRKTGEPLLIEKLDDVMFSEVMRDVDLAVSLAFVGGVDPVTSTSTLELRKSIIGLTCELMNLPNVRLEGHFAHIEGQYNDYSVHLGSGVIHQKAGSAIHMVPVWSGRRGKVYLPFLDEDPMTAQIVTKVVMLAEDTSIKDPEILSQIRRR